MPTAYEILGLVFATISLLAMIPIMQWIQSCLPTARLAYFDEIVEGTETLLLSLEEDKIFSNPDTAAYYRQRLRRSVHRVMLSSQHHVLTADSDDCRVREEAQQSRWCTYQATTMPQQIRGLFSGLSQALSDLCDAALELRAEISVRGRLLFSPLVLLTARADNRYR